MTRWIRWVSGAMVLALALLLPACSKERGASKQHSPAQTAPAKTHVTLKITSYGPDKVTAGQAFNTQPSGNAAVWIRVDRSLNGSDATIHFNGKRLTSAISGTLITAGVPVDLYAKPGTYQLYVGGTQGNTILRSNDVQLLVQ